MKSIGLQPGAVVQQQWQVVRKLGEGGCGVVFLVHHLHSAIHAALKVGGRGARPNRAAQAEPFGVGRDDELLKMEVHVLKRLSHGQHACRLLATGKGASFYFMVMTLTGRSLGDLRKACPQQVSAVGGRSRRGCHSTAAFSSPSRRCTPSRSCTWPASCTATSSPPTSRSA